MKSKTTLVYFSLLFFLLSTFKLNAQYYQFSQHNQSYQPIANASYVVSDSAIINNYSLLVQSTFSSGTPIKAFGEDIPSKTLFGGTNGFISMTGTHSDFAIDVFLDNLRSNGQSEFRADRVFIGPDTIYEIEWSNFRLAGHPDTDFITFKARFYVTRELIEFHYGPSNLSLAVSANVGVVKATPGFTALKEVLFLSGNPANPGTTTTTVSALNGFPANGTVYRFTGPTPVGLGQTKEEPLISLSLSPNPARDQVMIKSNEQILRVDILSINGKLIERIEKPFNQINLPLVNFDKGIYLLSFIFENGSSQQRKLLVE